MAIMQLNSRMVEWKIELAPTDGAQFNDCTSTIGPATNSIRIRHGISEGSSTKSNITSSAYEIASHTKSKRITAPSELDLQISCFSYLEDLFRPGVWVKISFKNNFGIWIQSFNGQIRNYPYGGAKDMINFNVRAFSREILFSNQQKNRSFKTRPLTQKAVVTEIAIESGFVVDFDSPTALNLVKPNNRILLQKGITDMQMLDKLAYEWNCHWYFDESKPTNTIVWRGGKDTFGKGDTESIYSSGTYIMAYRTDFIANNNVESVDWVETSSPGGTDIVAGVTSYNEKGVESEGRKIVILGKTWVMKPQYVALSKSDPLAFRNLTAYSLGLTATGRGYDALKTFYQIDPYNDPKSAENAIPNEGDQGGVELTIMLNDGDIDLRAPRTGILYCGGDLDTRTNANLPVWLFQYSDMGDYIMKLNIKETVLTYEQGMLKSELKCTLRTGN